jgi:hypothetical protein
LFNLPVEYSAVTERPVNEFNLSGNVGRGLLPDINIASSKVWIILNSFDLKKSIS